MNRERDRGDGRRTGAARPLAPAQERAKAPPAHPRPRTAPARTLTIESIAAGGAGVAHDEGRAVFVPRTAPGDVVEATIEPRAGALAGRVLRVVTPGPARVDPPCVHIDACGGCDLMHLTAEAQREAHRAIVTEALRRQAGIEALPAIVTHDVHPSPEGAPAAPGTSGPARSARAALGYRTRARLFARAERGRVKVGFRAAGSRELVSIGRCIVLAPELDAVLAELPGVLAGAKGDGEISLARGQGGKAVVEVSWRGELPPAVWSRVDERVRASAWAGARVWQEDVKAPAVFGDPRPVVMGADGRLLVVAAGGFAQPSDEAAAVLARRVAALAAKSGDAPGSIVELFAGSGTLSILLAAMTTKLVAVESEETSVRAARENLASRGLTAKVVCADADAFEPGRADVVVLDPPRTGARGAAAKIAASPARAVVYVACEPTTMARDVATLAAAGFAVTDVETVEIFPQTSHVETLVRLARGKQAAGA